MLFPTKHIHFSVLFFSCLLYSLPLTHYSGVHISTTYSNFFSMEKALLSVLSHVSHGYVGNRATTFPLQYYGWDVDTINTTDFSNHPGYGHLKGTVATPDHIRQLFQGLRDIQPLESLYSVLMVGYCPNSDVMQAIYDEITPALTKHPKPVLVVDPVLGDNGRLYVPESVVPVHKQFLRQGLVDLTTPNQFEMELLTGITICDWALARQALETFYHHYKVPNVVILSVVIDDKMYSVGYCHLEPEASRMFRVAIDAIACSFSGCGDVFSGLLTHDFFANNCQLTPSVLGQVLARLGQILQFSYDDEKRKTGHQPTMVRDVRLIQLRKVLDQAFSGPFDLEYI